MGLSLTKVDWSDEPSLREKVYFGVVFILIIFAMMRLFWLPAHDVIEKKKQDIKNVKLQISTLEKFIDIDKKIVPQKPAVKKDAVDRHLEEILKNMSANPKEAITEVVKEITSRKLMGSVVLNSLSFETATVRGSYTAVPVSLNVMGTFSALQNYLTMIERLKYLFTVDNIKFSFSEDHPGMLVADLAASIYIGGK